jgi:hypothetical protein
VPGCSLLQSVDAPQHINLLSGVRLMRVACGGACTAAVTVGGELLLMGCVPKRVSDFWDLKLPQGLVCVRAGCMGATLYPPLWYSGQRGNLWAVPFGAAVRRRMSVYLGRRSIRRARPREPGVAAQTPAS